MPVRIHGRGPRRYRQAKPGDSAHPISAADALRAFADDLLETGDARLALERAFRWGYRDDAGAAVPGLQHQLQELRHRREHLVRQIERSDFLDALAPELDRLDALDGRSASEDEMPFDRLLDRLEQGYESREAQEAIDSLRSALAEAIGGGEPRGGGRPGGGTMRAARETRADVLRRMLFSGGVEGDSGGEGAYRRDPRHGQSSIDASYLDLELLAELERVEMALGALDALGSVAALPDQTVDALRDADLPDIAEWLDQWRAAAGAVLPVTPGESVDLPPEVVSAISRDLLKSLFRAASSPLRGDHQTMAAGTAGDPSESTVPWEPGRPLDLDLVATVSSAVRRGGGGRGRVTLVPGDFAVIERGSSVAVSTVLAIDRSRSMGQRGGWVAARKLALALHELIRQSYPRDSLDVVSFSSSAERVRIGDVPRMPWDRFEHGTHLQAALALARQLLRRARAGTRQVVVITDGEPTLATIRGEAVFASPPTEELLAATMAEVIRCTREGIRINLVMLGGQDRGGFAEQVARINRGRVFTATTETLGAYVLRDYINR